MQGLRRLFFENINIFFACSDQLNGIPVMLSVHRLSAYPYAICFSAHTQQKYAFTCTNQKKSKKNFGFHAT
jgi:hypothetical protein